MKTKSWLCGMILAIWLIGATGMAQEISDPPTYPTMGPRTSSSDVPVFQPPSPLVPNAAPEQVRPLAGGSSGGLSDWILYRRAGCESPHGPHTPLYTEMYLEAGPSFPVGTSLSRELTIGWSIAGGLRLLCFNESHRSAWVVDGHLINTNLGAGGEHKSYPVTFYHNGQRSDLVVFEISTNNKKFTLQNLNRTSVGLGFGREWYPLAPADSDGKKWRLGADVGGRYGSERVNFSEFGHITNVVGGMYAGGHSSFECPWRGWIWHIGLRAEWAYTWSDTLQVISDTQTLNLFLTGGIRY